jgi:hypothetical protein
MAITCSLIALSGGARYWRGLQFYGVEEQTRTCPFPLADLPKSLGSWQMKEGIGEQLDPEIARVAGSSDHIIRNYMDPKTGQTVSVLVLYGLGQLVSPHTPDACYAGAGYATVPAVPMTDYERKIPGSDKIARYRAGLFARRVAGHTEYTEVVYSFRHRGQWLPNAVSLWRAFRYHPGLFKIQIARPVTAVAIESGPSVELLGQFMREIENRLAQKADPAVAQAPSLEDKTAGKVN